jgi:hypothetical protein
MDTKPAADSGWRDQRSAACGTHEGVRQHDKRLGPRLAPRGKGVVQILGLSDGVELQRHITRLRRRRQLRPRGTPRGDRPDAGTGGFDPNTQPAPAYEFDQRIAW